MQSTKANNDFIKEVNSNILEYFQKSTIKDTLILIKKEALLAKQFSSDKDFKRYQNKMNSLIGSLNRQITELNNIYNDIYVNSFGVEGFDLAQFEKMHFQKVNGNYTLYYYDRLPKDSKMNFQNSSSLFSAIVVAIQTYIDKQNLYPKPQIKKAKIVFETVYDIKSKKHIWDNDHISRHHISEIINAFQFVGLINNDEGLNISFEVRSNIKKISDKIKNKYYKDVDKKGCIAYTKISIIT